MSKGAIEKRENRVQKQENTVHVPQRREQATYYTPLVDIIETGEEFVFQADLPGATSDDLDISFQQGVLTLEANITRRWTKGQSWVWQEYGIGNFYRQFTLNTPVNADAIRAEFKNGVLELHVPKAESARTRRIQIQSA
jgi:HSP20 family molecular chaperone IbpA